MAKVVYGEQLLEWERHVMESIGVRPEIGWIVCALVSVGVLIARWCAGRSKMRRRRDDRARTSRTTSCRQRRAATGFQVARLDPA